jgi:membrane fusion protein, macrolide-specific efflux system
VTSLQGAARRLWRPKVLIPTVLVVVVAAGAGTWSLTRPSAAATGVTYRATTATTGTIRQSVAASGTIEPESTQDLSFSSAGTITGVYVTAGQAVAKGQKLAAIDSATLRSQLAAAKATLATARARLSDDQTAGESSEQIAADQASVVVAQSQVTSAGTALGGATLTAPIAGTVTAVNVALGQQVSSGSSGTNSGSGGTGNSGSGGNSGTGNSGTGNSGTGASTGSSSASASSSGTSAAVQVVSTGSYLVNATVDATDITRVKKGQQVVITPSGATAPVFGLVSSVGILASSTSGVASFPVVVDVTGSPTGLYAGATADLQIVYKQLSDVVTVPTLAIRRAQDKSYVLVPSGQSQAEKEVTVGVSSGGLTQVVSGLSEGDTVLVAVPAGNTGGNRTGRGGGGFGGGGGGQVGGGGGFGGGGFGGAGGAGGATQRRAGGG